MNTDSWQRGLIRLTRRSGGPAYLLHAITRRTHEHDGSATVGATPGRGEELSLDEIRCVAARLPRTVARVRIEGGEPFLRQDLAEIVAAYAGQGSVRRIEIATDGWLPDTIEEQVSAMLRDNPALQLTLALGLHGVDEAHDRLCGRVGAFSRAQATAHALRRIASTEPRLRLRVDVAVSDANRDHLGPLLSHLTGALGGPAVSCWLAPGVGGRPTSNPETLRSFQRFTRLLALAREAGEVGRSTGRLGPIEDSRADLAWSWALREARGEPTPRRCHAGRSSGALDPDGTVRACLSRSTTLGNVREADYRLGRVWHGATARAERARIAREPCRCACQCCLARDLVLDLGRHPGLILDGARKSLARREARRSARLSSDRYDTAYLMSQLLEGYREFREGRLSVVKARELEMLALEKGTSLLEVGFGRGEFLMHCARRGAKVAGIDYSKDAYEIAVELLRDHPEADLRVADCRDLPFPNESFERVFSGDVIEHVNYQDGVLMLQEMLRVLKPGGFLLLHTTPNTVFTKRVYPLAKRFLRLIDARTIEKIDHHMAVGKTVHVHEYNIFSLRRAAKDAGLTGARVWIDADVLRSGEHPYTATFGRNPLIRWAASMSRSGPVRFLLGNDLYLKYVKPAR
jgi:ubiquinone/menaquinone biosynthesis C-methylase UbiE/MoaA/NifB/PqqE/SkfB family radical SAM enzyme